MKHFATTTAGAALNMRPNMEALLDDIFLDRAFSDMEPAVARSIEAEDAIDFRLGLL